MLFSILGKTDDEDRWIIDTPTNKMEVDESEGMCCNNEATK